MITFRPVALVPDPEPSRCAYRTTDAATGATVRCPNQGTHTAHGYRVCKACRDRPSGVLAREVVPVRSAETAGDGREAHDAQV